MKDPKLHQRVVVYGVIKCRGKAYGNAVSRWKGSVRFVGAGFVVVETRTHMMISANRRQCVGLRRKKKG